MPRADSEYADVAAMFCCLATLDPHSAAFEREREAIIKRTMPLADHIARRFRNRGEALDDLTQAARVGLLKAVNRFNHNDGTHFLSFAVPTIVGEVRRHFRDHAWAVKVPRRLKELHGRLTRARDEFAQRAGRLPTATELADCVNVERETVIDWGIASNNYTTLSIDKPVAADNEQVSIGDTLGGLDPKLENVVDIETIRPFIAALPERQRAVLALRFFEEMTQSQIAEHIGCSQMHVSRLLGQALRTLRSQAQESDTARSGMVMAASV